MSKILKLFMMLLLTAACSPKDNREELTIIDSDGNKNVYKVELAQTKEELSTGLMNRTALDADSGMVFDLSDFNNVPTAMWMKDTKIALDMLFIDRDGMIYWIFENAEPDSVKMIVAPYPATAVLEINAGDVKAKGIEIGDMVEYKLFPVEKAAAADANEVADEGQDEDDTPVETVVEEDKAEIEETVAEDEKAAAEYAACFGPLCRRMQQALGLEEDAPPPEEQKPGLQEAVPAELTTCGPAGNGVTDSLEQAEKSTSAAPEETEEKDRE